MKHRKLFYEIIEYIGNEHSNRTNIALLLGLRRMGKTTILQQLRDYYGGSAVYIDCREHSGTNDWINVAIKSKADYIFVDELTYSYEFDLSAGEFQSLFEHKFVLLTASSYGALKQLAKERLGAGRAKIFELFPLSFEEFLYFRDKINWYGEDYIPSEQDVQDFYRLRSIPTGLQFILNRDYFTGEFDDIEEAIENQRCTVRQVVLKRAEHESILNIFAYTLNRMMKYKRLTGNIKIGVQEYGAIHPFDFSNSIMELSTEGVNKYSPKQLGKIIAFLYYNGYMYFRDNMAKGLTCPSKLIKTYIDVETVGDLKLALEIYPLNVISPLLYTRLMHDLENISGEAVVNPMFMGELYEMALTSETVYKSGYDPWHRAYMFREDGHEMSTEVDIIQMNGLDVIMICEATIRHKMDEEHMVGELWKELDCLRVLTDIAGVYTKEDNYYRIGYPLALYMISSGSIYKIDKKSPL